MKRVTNSICATALILGGAVGISSSANAVAISYEGAISVPFGAVSGSVSGTGWANDIAAETDFWTFQVGAGGAALDIWGLRGDEPLDTVFTVYRGTTTADESEFKHLSDFGGMSVVAFADDQIAADGPFGDPALHSTLFPEGAYTIAIGGNLSTGNGPFTYKLSIGIPGSSPGAVIAPEIVPIPAAAWLFGSALIGLVGIRRRKLKS